MAQFVLYIREIDEAGHSYAHDATMSEPMTSAEVTELLAMVDAMSCYTGRHRYEASINGELVATHGPLVPAVNPHRTPVRFGDVL